MIKIISALDIKHNIGNNNNLLYRIPSDLKRFKELTTNSYIIMGRKTWESIGSKPLPNRKNIVISRKIENIRGEGFIYCENLEEALEVSNNECYIIGGGELYKQAIKIADKMHLTWIDTFDSIGDVSFPDINYLKWNIVYKSGKISENGLDFEFIDYIRNEN